MINNRIKYEGVSSLKNKEVFFCKSKIIDSIIKLRNGKIDIKSFVKGKVIVEKFIYEFIDASKIKVEASIKCVSEYCGQDNTAYIYTDTANILFSENLDLRKKIINRNKIKLNAYIEDVYIEQFNDREYLISIMVTIAVPEI